MRNILSKDLRRELEILESLYFQTNQNIYELMEKLQCSEKTLRRSVQLINQKFSPFHIDIFNAQCILSPLHQQTIDFIYTKIYHLSPEFQIFEYLFFHPRKKTIDTLAQYFHLSSSTTRRIIERLKNYLKNFEIIIATPYLSIEGNEIAIRNLYTHYFLEKKTVHFFSYTEETEQILDFLFCHLSEIIGFKKTRHFFNIFKWSTFTSIIRTKQKFFVSEQSIDFEQDFSKKLAATAIMKKLAPIFQFPLEEKQIADIFFFFQPIIPHINPQQSDVYTHKQLDIIAKWLLDFEKKHHISIEQPEQFKIFLYNIINSYYGNSFILFNKNKYILTFLTTQYPQFIPQFMQEIEQLFKNLNIHPAHEQVFDLGFAILNRRPKILLELTPKKQIKKIALYLETNLEMQWYVETSLKKIFPLNFQFEVIDFSAFQKITRYAQTKFDLCITNSLPTFSLKLPYIVINEYLLEQEIERLHLFLKQNS